MRKLAFLFALALAAQAHASEDKIAAKRHYEEGMKQYNLADFRVAKQEFKAAYLAFPDPSFLFNLGQCARRLSEPEEALNYYRAYLRAQPDTPKRTEVDGFIHDAEAELKRRSAEKPPTETEPPKQLGATQGTSATVTDTPAPRRWWIWAVVAASAAVVVGVVAVVLAFVIPNNAPDPATTAGVSTVRFP